MSKVSIPTGSRPAMAAVVRGWSANLQSGARAALPDGARMLDDWLGVNFAKHHILPQTVMQVLPGLATARLPESQQARQQRLVEAIRAISAGDAGRPPNWSLGPIAWSPVNLFEGPTGYYRNDDPGESGERQKPKSFDARRWFLLQQLAAAIASIGQQRGEAFETSTEALMKMQKGGVTGLEAVVRAVQALADFVGPDLGVHPFTDTDWVDRQKLPLQLTALRAYRDARVVVAVQSSRKSAYALR